MTDIPAISLSTFTDYLTALGAQRIQTVASAVEQYAKGYNPGRDFYRPWIDACQAGFESGGGEWRFRRAVEHAKLAAQRTNFPDLTTGWQAWREGRTVTDAIVLGSVTWHASGLNVRVKPHLAATVDGTDLAIRLHLRDGVPSKDAIKATHRLLTRHVISDGRVPALLDVRRGKLHVPSKRPYARNFDAWLDGEAAGFAQCWHGVKRAA